jgi:hypothetical protein
MRRIRYGKYYAYRLWSEILGWVIAFLSILPIPIGAIHAIHKADGNTLLQVDNQIDRNISDCLSHLHSESIFVTEYRVGRVA